MFCVECGREGELIGSLCEECYSKKHVKVSIPDHVDVTLCAHCSSALTDKGWEDVGSVKEAAEMAIGRALILPKDARVSDLQVRLTEKDERNLEASVVVLVSAQGHSFPRELSTTVRLKSGSCNECSKQQGRYYEAILQVRGQERVLPRERQAEIERLVSERVATMRKTSREVFVSKVERVKGGLDFYFGTVSSARALAKELQETMCADYKESSSLWGRRDGKDVYRMTFLVRLQAFATGDVVILEGRAYLVHSLSKGMLHVIDLLTGEDRSIRLRDRSECALAVPKGKILKAIVLMETERELQVLDPETMAPADVAKPPGFSRKGEQVRLAKTKLGTYVISDSW